MNIKKLYVGIIILMLVVVVIFVVNNKNENKVEGISEERESEKVSDENTEVLEEPGFDLIKPEQIKEFIVTGDDFSFTPNDIRVKKGDEVRIVFKSTQGFHDFIIEGYNVATKQLRSPGEEVIQFTADKTGTFEYYCSVGTHRQMGMIGIFVVEE